MGQERYMWEDFRRSQRGRLLFDLAWWCESSRCSLPPGIGLCRFQSPNMESDERWFDPNFRRTHEDGALFLLPYCMFFFEPQTETTHSWRCSAEELRYPGKFLTILLLMICFDVLSNKLLMSGVGDLGWIFGKLFKSFDDVPQDRNTTHQLWTP